MSLILDSSDPDALHVCHINYLNESIISQMALNEILQKMNSAYKHFSIIKISKTNEAYDDLMRRYPSRYLLNNIFNTRSGRYSCSFYPISREELQDFYQKYK